MTNLLEKIGALFRPGRAHKAEIHDGKEEWTRRRATWTEASRESNEVVTFWALRLMFPPPSIAWIAERKRTTMSLFVGVISSLPDESPTVVETPPNVLGIVDDGSEGVDRIEPVCRQLRE